MNKYDVFEKLCKEKGVNATNVSNATGVPRSTFTDWKKGRSKPKTDKLQLIADYFGVPLETFTDGSKERRGLNVPDLFAGPDLESLTHDKAALRKIFDNALDEALTGRYRLTDDERKIILAYRVAPESTKDIIRKILDVKKDASGSLTEAG